MSSPRSTSSLDANLLKLVDMGSVASIVLGGVDLQCKYQIAATSPGITGKQVSAADLVADVIKAFANHNFQSDEFHNTGVVLRVSGYAEETVEQVTALFRTVGVWDVQRTRPISRNVPLTQDELYYEAFIGHELLDAMVFVPAGSVQLQQDAYRLIWPKSEVDTISSRPKPVLIIDYKLLLDERNQLIWPAAVILEPLNEQGFITVLHTKVARNLRGGTRSTRFAFQLVHTPHQFIWTCRDAGRHESI